jgi:hypothetical protein
VEGDADALFAISLDRLAYAKDNHPSARTWRAPSSETPAPTAWRLRLLMMWPGFAVACRP